MDTHNVIQRPMREVKKEKKNRYDRIYDVIGREIKNKKY